MTTTRSAYRELLLRQFRAATQHLTGEERRELLVALRAFGQARAAAAARRRALH